MAIEQMLNLILCVLDVYTLKNVTVVWDTNAGVEKCGRTFAPRDRKRGVLERDLQRRSKA